MSSSTDISLGTVGTFRKFPRSELELEQSLEASLEISSLPVPTNNLRKVWKFVWRSAAVAILLLLGYGLIQFGSMNFGSVLSDPATTYIPMPAWTNETSNSTLAPESTFKQETSANLSAKATMASTTATVLKWDPTATSNPLGTVTLSELAKAKKWCPWGMNYERCNRYHDQFTTTVEPAASQQTFNAEYCTQQLGNQTYLEVNWLCRYCHRRASVWNKMEWGLVSFARNCSSNCFDNKYRRACAKRAFQWNQKTGEFGSPFNCKHC